MKLKRREEEEETLQLLDSMKENKSHAKTRKVNHEIGTNEKDYISLRTVDKSLIKVMF